MLERKQYIHSTPSHIPNWTCQKKARIQLFSYFKRHHPSLHVHRFTHQPTTQLRSIDSFRASLMALLITEDEEDASREGLFRPRPPSARSRIRKPTDRSSHKMEDSWTVCTFLGWCRMRIFNNFQEIQQQNPPSNHQSLPRSQYQNMRNLFVIEDRLEHAA